MSKNKIVVNVSTEVPSPSLSLNKTDYKKIVKGAIIAFSGAALVSITEWLITGNVELWKPALIAAVSVGINAAWKFLQGQN